MKTKYLREMFILSFLMLCLFSTNGLAQNTQETDLLKGKRIGVIGDSYVKNHAEPIANTWHYKLAEKHQMQYYNYGINGNCIAMPRERYGEAMYKRYQEMADSLDYVIVIAGHNDSFFLKEIGIDNFKAKLATLCQGLIEKYPTAKIFFFTRWTCQDFAGSDAQKSVDMMIEVCGNYGIPVFDAARRSNIFAQSDAFRTIYFQNEGKGDNAHLNGKGHDRFLKCAESFILSY